MIWLSENLSTVIVCLVLAAIVTLIIFSMIKDKKKGKSSCGCNCNCCPMGENCHKADNGKNK